MGAEFLRGAPHAETLRMSRHDYRHLHTSRASARRWKISYRRQYA